MHLISVFNGLQLSAGVLSNDQIVRWGLKAADIDQAVAVVAAYDRGHGADTALALDRFEERFKATRWMRFVLRALARLKTPEGDPLLLWDLACLRHFLGLAHARGEAGFLCYGVE